MLNFKQIACVFEKSLAFGFALGLSAYVAADAVADVRPPFALEPRCDGCVDDRPRSLLGVLGKNRKRNAAVSTREPFQNSNARRLP